LHVVLLPVASFGSQLPFFQQNVVEGFRCDIVHRKTISLLLLLLLPAVALACRFCRLFLFVCVTTL